MLAQHILIDVIITLQVMMGFLPVGHTHEDIDQLFSCVSRKLKHCAALPDHEL